MFFFLETKIIINILFIIIHVLCIFSHWYACTELFDQLFLRGMPVLSYLIERIHIAKVILPLLLFY